MPKLVDIVTKFDTTRKAVGGINNFLCDTAVSSMNADKEKEYPAMLLWIPVGNFINPEMDTKDYKIDFALFDLWFPNSDNETRTKEDVWQALEAKAKSIVALIEEDRPDYGLLNPTKEPVIAYSPYPLHNDKLIGVKCSFNMRIFYGC